MASSSSNSRGTKEEGELSPETPSEVSSLHSFSPSRLLSPLPNSPKTPSDVSSLHSFSPSQLHSPLSESLLNSLLSLSRSVSIRPYNPNEHLVDTEWIAPKAEFLPFLEEGEIPDASDLERWKAEIVEQERALNTLASPKVQPACSRGNNPTTWVYDGTLDMTEQDLRPERSLPPHRYRHFRHETELLRPENIDEVHRQSHVQAESSHQRTHDRLEDTSEEERLAKEREDRTHTIIDQTSDRHYVANVPRFILGLHQNTIRSDHVRSNPFGDTEFPRHGRFQLPHRLLWPSEPVVYPNHVREPPHWRTCHDRQDITQFLPKLKGQELCNAWAHLNQVPGQCSITWSPRFLTKSNEYFPVVIHAVNKDCWLGAWNRTQQVPDRPWPWMTMSQLNFVPDDVHTIIAGEKGLVVLDGGEYLALPRQDFWKLEWPSQSATVVVNPLNRTLQLLPPVEDEKYSQEFKRAKLVVEEQPGLNKSHYVLYMVGQRSLPYEGSQVTIYDSRTNKYTDINHYEVPPTPRGLSSVVLIHGHLYWSGLKCIGQHERVTEIQSKQFQPAMGMLEQENVVVCYSIEHRRFGTLGFELNRDVGDLGCADGFEAGRLVDCRGIAYLVTRQVRSKREFRMPQRSDSVKLVYPPRIFRLYYMADPIRYHPMQLMPSEVHLHLFGPNQTSYQQCQFEARAGLGDICLYSLRKHTFALFNAELDDWTCLALTYNIVPSLPTLLLLGDCVLSPNFRAEPACQPQEHRLAWMGRGESYPEWVEPPPDSLLPNETHRRECCVHSPIPYREGADILGPGQIELQLQNPPTEREQRYQGSPGRLPTGRVRRESSIERVGPGGPERVRRTSAQRMSYNPPQPPPDWGRLTLQELTEGDRPPQPPQRPVRPRDEFNPY